MSGRIASNHGAAAAGQAWWKSVGHYAPVVALEGRATITDMGRSAAIDDGRFDDIVVDASAPLRHLAVELAGHVVWTVSAGAQAAAREQFIVHPATLEVWYDAPTARWLFRDHPDAVPRELRAIPRGAVAGTGTPHLQLKVELHGYASARILRADPWPAYSARAAA